ncbi:MAG: hypothetical protein ACRDQ6_01005 [Pseudonocardiaceae bacterium]
MPTWICVTCGVQQAATAEPPPACPICEDERQYVGWEGQRWTTGTELARDRTSDLREEETDLLGIGTSPSFAIGQRALLVCTERGNVLWDCVSLLDDAALEEVTRRGASRRSACHIHISTPRASNGRTHSMPRSSFPPRIGIGSSVPHHVSSYLKRTR